jgi:putative DNA primase/helicase
VGASLEGVWAQFVDHDMPQIDMHQLRADGKKYTYGPKKKAWYRLYEYVSNKTGKIWYSGVFGYKADNWKVESDGSYQQITPEEREAAAREWKRKDDARLAREARAAEFAANRAKQQWKAAVREGVSAYLERKKVARPEAVRFMADGNIIIPLLRYDTSTMVGSQKIAPDGSKLFNKGFAKPGAACRLGDEPMDGDLILLAEGYATAASVREGVAYQHPVYMALDAGNLVAVAKILRAKYPASPLVIAADDDYLTGGVGKAKAEAACREAGNARYVLPTFTIARHQTEGDELPEATDFNDLHVHEGIEAVKTQWLAALSPAPSQELSSEAAAEPAPAPDTDTGGAGGETSSAIARLLYKQYALVEGKTRVIDKSSGSEYTMAALKARFGKEPVDGWLARPDKLLVTQAEVSAAKRARDEQARRTDPAMVPYMQRYVYLDGSTSVWDSRLQEVIPAAAAKLAMGGSYDYWVDSPDRRVVPLANVRFAPGVDLPEDGFINLWAGMEMQPDWPQPAHQLPRDIWKLIALFPKCHHILRLALHLCDGRMEVLEWLLNWIAYPLQHVGAKMDTAILMHGSVHGTGKSMFWEKVVKPLYGRYAITLGQSELESQYTGSRSAKLFLLFEEVISSKQRYSQTGKLKHMITGLTQVIEKKFMNAWEESNHAQCVFLSNAIQPLHIEAYDRRFLVIWPLETAADDIYIDVDREVSEGGLEAFYAFLQALPLTLTVQQCPEAERTGDQCMSDCPSCAGLGHVPRPEAVKFDRHTKPLMTNEKARVIRYGLSGWELFLHQWVHEELGELPFVSCSTRDLYRVYRWWCNDTGDHAPISENKFSINVSCSVPGKLSKRNKARWRFGSHGTMKQGQVFKVGMEPDGLAEMDYLGDHISKFRQGAKQLGIDLAGEVSM